MKEKPIYQIEIDETDETGIELISIVGRPAIQIKGVTMAEIDEEGCPSPPCHEFCQCTIVNGQWKLGESESGPCEYCIANKKRYNRNKNRPGAGRFSEFKEYFADDEKMIIAGPTMIPDMLIDRSDEWGEYQTVFTKEVIERIVRKFFKNNGTQVINFEHTDEMVKGYIMEHWIVEDTYKDKSNIYGFELPVGSHFMMVKIEDKKFWDQEVKKNGKTGFSIEGMLGHKLVRMSMEELIDTLTLEEIETIVSEFSKPYKNEKEDEFISRCISEVMNDGSAKDTSMGYAMCKSMWDNKK